MPAAKPLELKRKLGTARPGRIPKAMAVLSPADLDRVPDHLGVHGSVVWRDAQEQTTWIGPSDVRALLTLCELYDRRAELIAFLTSEGYSAYTEKGYAYLRPEAGLLTVTEDSIRKWSSLLGLTPADRSRLGVAEVKAASTLERLAAARDGRRSTSLPSAHGSPGDQRRRPSSKPMRASSKTPSEDPSGR